MHARRLAVAAVLAVASLGVMVPAGRAAAQTCDGLEATIVGTDGSDNLIGTEDPDVVFLGGGDDHFAGKGGDDVICGGAGHDVIYPGDGNDTVFGENGPDTIFEGTGNDHLNGGPGGDTLDYRNSQGTGLRVDARIGKATSSNGTDLFYNVESYVGTVHQDHLIGLGGDDHLIGGDDFDSANGGPGHDHCLYFEVETSCAVTD